MSSLSPYRPRSTYRPFLFWWQAVTLFAAFILLVGMLVGRVSRSSVSIIAMPLPEPTATYVTLAPDYAAQLFKRSLTTWMTGRDGKQNISELDLRVLDFDNGLPAPAFLEQRTVLPDSLQPVAAATLPVTFAEIPVPSAAPAKATPPPQRAKEGLFIEVPPALVAAGFTFPSNELKAMKERSGECRFYVETDAEGNVAHVLLRSKPSPETVTIEHSLMRGRAHGAANGTVDIRWSFAK